MGNYRVPDGNSEYTFHFSSEGFDVLRELAHQQGRRSTESMLRLIAATVNRDRSPIFRDGEYSAHDLSVTKIIFLSDDNHARLMRLADAKGVPRECLGDLLMNYVVRS